MQFTSAAFLVFVAAAIVLHWALPWQRARLCVLLALVQRPPPRWEEAVADHERMLKALRARDGKAFAHIAREHLRHRSDIANAALAKLEQWTGERKRGGEALGGGQ